MNRKSVELQTMQNYAGTLSNAIEGNKKCDPGVFGCLRVYFSNGWTNHITDEDIVYPEILCMLHMAETSGFYWYGYAAPLNKESDRYVALILKLKHFVNISVSGNIFGAFNNIITCFGGYEPCRIQNEDDAYKEGHSFEEAVEALVAMIKRFDLTLREPDIHSSHSLDAFELRVFEFLGFRRWM